jgi:valyl-tRNA synthetase
MDVGRIEGYRKFCNKLWNATKFCLFRMGLVDLEGKRLQGDFVPNKSSLVCLLTHVEMVTDPQPTGSESVAERWLFHKLNYASEVVNSAMETRDFERASSAAYHFFLNDLCDVFIVCPLLTAWT